MSEHISIARTAREKLAAGLAALQDPGAPESLSNVAEPIAKAMGAMHRIERGDAAQVAAAEALLQVREALARLQASGEDHPAVEIAMENVAKSLSAVHTLALPSQRPPAVNDAPKAASAGGTQPVAAVQNANRAAAPTPQPSAPQQSGATQPIPKSVREPDVPTPAPQRRDAAPPSGSEEIRAQRAPATQPQILDAAIPLERPASSHGGTQPIAAVTRTAPQIMLEASPLTEPRPEPISLSPSEAPTKQVKAGSRPQSAPEPATPPPSAPLSVNSQSTKQSPKVNDVAAQAVPVALTPAAAPRSSPKQYGAPPAQFDVALGTNSNSNFYKGLSPGDLLESGGLFVATYNIPDLGAPVELKVTMPGGYEFTAEGTVAWTRDTPPTSSSSSNLSPPGFGARLAQLSADARALVQRYARNREPFFYDDL